MNTINLEASIKWLDVALLSEHPKNKDFFEDIGGEFWQTFVNDIAENGITLPLTVNKNTMQVIKGNQRLRAAKQLRLSQVPCLLVAYTTPEDELKDLIRDNILRRDVNVFTKFKMVELLREKYQSRQGVNQYTLESGLAHNEPKLRPRDELVKELNVSKHFVSMADLYNSLPPEKQSEAKKWFNEKFAETGSQPSQKELSEHIKKVNSLEKENYNLRQQQQQLSYKLDEFKKVHNLEQDLDLKKRQLNERREELRKMQEKMTEHNYDYECYVRAKKIIDQASEHFGNLKLIEDLPLTDGSRKALRKNISVLVENMQDFIKITKEFILQEV